MKLSTLLLFLRLSSYTIADKLWFQYDSDYYTYSGCLNSLQDGATFCNGTDPEKCFCIDINALGSLLYCGYKDTHVNNTGFNSKVASGCSQFTDLTSDAYYEKVYQYAVENIVDVTNNSSYNSSDPIDYPITSIQLYQSFYDYKISVKNEGGNIFLSHILGVSFVGGVFAVMIVTGIINWCMRTSRILSNALDKGVMKTIRMNFILKIFHNHLHPTLLGVCPDAVESFFITIMFVYSILSCCIIGYHWYPNDPAYDSYMSATSMYWGERSSIIFSYQLPFLFLFPGRNNFFQYITRWKYSRFVTFHKWLGRIIVLEVLIHSIAMGVQTYASGQESQLDEDWYRFGIAATIICCLIPVVSIYFIRRHWYEIFLCIHIILASMFIWTAWVHAADQQYQDFYLACCVIWVFDRVVRLCRICSNGIQTVIIDYYPGEDAIIKFSIDKSKFFNNYQPGSHAFITFISKDTFWQSHPFTAYEKTDDSSKVSFCCLIKNGVTKKIADKFKSKGVQSLEMKVLIDGFYGEQSHYQQHNKAVFIVGNTGITGPFAHLKSLTRSKPNARVELYWGIRSYDSLKWFSEELLSLKGTNCTPKIFISQPEKSTIGKVSPFASKFDYSCYDKFIDKGIRFQLDSKDEDFEQVLEFVEITHSRMSVPEILDDELKYYIGNVAFGACAHNQVVDCVRMEVASRLKSYHRIDYFEEMQVW